MQGYSVLIIIVAYFAVLLTISHLVSRKYPDNDAFFRQQTIALVGGGYRDDCASISGVSFVSVPGMVRELNFGYMQMVLGFFGYVVIAKVLLPLYYRLNLTTIYTYLKDDLESEPIRQALRSFCLGKPSVHQRVCTSWRLFCSKQFLCLNVPFG